METTEKKVKDEEVSTVSISFGNPSNEITRGELRLSSEEEMSRTVAIVNISTKFSLKEFCDFISLSSNLC